jgi:hypothetical protein
MEGLLETCRSQGAQEPLELKDQEVRAISIQEFLGINAAEEFYPATSQLQAAVTEILEEDPTAANKSPLLEALMLAIVDLETALLNLSAELIDTKDDLLAAKNHRIRLMTYIIELEARIINARVKLAPAPDITFYDLIEESKRIPY